MSNASCRWIVAIIVLFVGPACSFGPRPRTAVPGQRLQLRTFRTAFADDEPVVVRVGGRSASLIRVLGPHRAEYLMPRVAPGSASVEVRAGEKLLANYHIEVPEPAYQQVVLAMEGGRVERLATFAAYQPGRPEQAEDGLLLHWEVVDPDGSVLASGVRLHPSRQRHEVYGVPEQHRMRMVPAPGRQVFTLTLDRTPPGCTLRLFEVAGATRAKRAEGATGGRLLAELPLGTGGAS